MIKPLKQFFGSTTERSVLCVNSETALNSDLGPGSFDTDLINKNHKSLTAAFLTTRNKNLFLINPNSPGPSDYENLQKKIKYWESPIEGFQRTDRRFSEVDNKEDPGPGHYN